MPQFSTAALRLLEALASEGAYGFHAKPDEPGVLAIVGRLNGISLRRASAPVAAAEELEKSGFAVWERSARMGRRRLVLTACGWAEFIEISVPVGIEKRQRLGTISMRAEADFRPGARAPGR
jgi:hypothetical protein